MGKTVFRRIGGRIIPITIESEKLSSEGFTPVKKITAHAKDKIGNKVRAGSMHISVPEKGVKASVIDVKVEPHFRKKGLSGTMFEHAMEELGKEGKKFLRGDSVVHPAQAKIRGAKNSKFIGQGLGIYGDKSKILSPRKALEAVKKISKRQQSTINDPINVRATTMIPKKFRGTKK